MTPNTPLEELIEKMFEVKDMGGDLELAIAYARPFLQKEYSHTEQIAIGFSKWKFDNGWYIHSKLLDGTLIHFKHFGWDGCSKTDSELFKDYIESLKP